MQKNFFEVKLTAIFRKKGYIQRYRVWIFAFFPIKLDNFCTISTLWFFQRSECGEWDRMKRRSLHGRGRGENSPWSWTRCLIGRYSCSSESIRSNEICQEAYVGSAGDNVRRAVHLAQVRLYLNGHRDESLTVSFLLLKWYSGLQASAQLWVVWHFGPIMGRLALANPGFRPNCGSFSTFNWTAQRLLLWTVWDLKSCAGCVG